VLIWVGLKGPVILPSAWDPKTIRAIWCLVLAPADVPHAEIDAYFGSALRNSWIIAFASGYGEVVSKMGIPFLTLSLASLLGAVMVKSFILTTLDTCTRLSRFVVTGAFSKYSSQLKNRHLATLIALAPAYYLGVTDGYVAIWKLFGASNQLIAAVALIIITSFLVRAKKPRMFTLIPATFMLLTTIGALAWETFNPDTGYFVSDKPIPVLGTLAFILIILAVAVAVQCIRSWREN
jgi:carbon starvation protein